MSHLIGRRVSSIAEVEALVAELSNPADIVGDHGLFDVIVTDSPFFVSNQEELVDVQRRVRKIVNDSRPPVDCVIVGAGLSGLRAAQCILNRGVQDVLVLEGSDRVGGRL